ncbi:MAG TPA: disulfide bond formation protein B [Stellaceae bacterium]|nr:disulfide bond formation protein B [Stellaceae bacterium]
MFDLALSRPSATRGLLLLVLGASIAVIAGAFLFEYVGHLAPCEICLAERWPYYVAIVLSLLALATGTRWTAFWLALIAVAFLASTGLGAYHVGVEQQWIAGPTACTGSDIGVAKTVEELKRLMEGQQSVRCDVVQWTLFGISLAGFNLLISLGLLGIAAFGLHRCLREGSV